MKIRLIFSLLGLIPTFLLFGQDDIVVLSTSSSSGIEYFPSATDGRRVFAGLRLAANGVLILEEGRSANLVVKGKKVVLTGPDRIELATIHRRAGEKESSFLGRFWNFIGSAVTNTGNSRDVENYHQKYLTNTRAGVRGYGAGEAPIELPLYFSGPQSAGILELAWPALEGVTEYEVVLRHRSDDREVFRAVITTNRVSLPLAALPQPGDEVLILEIAAETADTKYYVSDVYLRYDPEAAASFIAETQTKRAYQSLTDKERPLYLAQSLEEDRYYADALRIYHELIDAEPDNLLYRRLLGAFLLRMNDLEGAKGQLKREIMQE